MTTRLQEKGTLESVVLGFDFSREAAGVLTPTFVITAETGTDPAPTLILVGEPQIGEFDVNDNPISPALVLQRVAGGIDQVNYRIQCTVQTVEGNTLTCATILPVRQRL